MPFVTLGAWMWQAEGVLYGQMAGALVFGLAALLTAFRVVGRLGRARTAGSSRTGPPRRPSLPPGKAALASLAATPTQAPER